MTTTKLTPDQLHRLIDEVAALAYRNGTLLEGDVYAAACRALGAFEGADWWYSRGLPAFRSHAGLSAVLILLSEGG